VGLSASGFGRKKVLDLIEGLSIDDGRVLTLEPLSL